MWGENHLDTLSVAVFFFLTHILMHQEGDSFIDSPLPVEYFHDNPISGVSCGRNTICVLYENGDLVAWVNFIFFMFVGCWKTQRFD